MAQKKKPTAADRRLLRKLQAQSLRASALRISRVWHLPAELGDLARVLMDSQPRARHVVFCGVRFPVRHTFCTRVVLCPDTGVPLVGAFDI